jgi:hypothetical protein
VSRAGEVTLVAVPFVWFGMVLAISFLEAPLKFRAPGVTLGLGLGIGRLVFRALNGAEAILALLLVAGGVVAGIPTIAWLLIAVLVALLAVQVAVLRPRLDRRAVAIIAGEAPPQSRQHLLYVAFEGAKVLVLPILGVILATSATR